MKRFQFRHQTLLDVAAQNERGIQIELARVQAVEIEARRRLDQTLQLWTEWDGRIRRNLQGLIEPRLLRDLMAAAEALRHRAGHERELLRAAERQTEAVRDRLKEAATARKAYERLRERLQTEYVMEDSRQQVKINDDTASVRVANAKSAAHAADSSDRMDRPDSSRVRQFEAGVTTGVPA